MSRLADDIAYTRSMAWVPSRVLLAFSDAVCRTLGPRRVRFDAGVSDEHEWLIMTAVEYETSPALHSRQIHSFAVHVPTRYVVSCISGDIESVTGRLVSGRQLSWDGNCMCTPCSMGWKPCYIVPPTRFRQQLIVHSLAGRLIGELVALVLVYANSNFPRIAYYPPVDRWPAWSSVDREQAAALDFPPEYSLLSDAGLLRHTCQRVRSEVSLLLSAD
jgi:hypothetical protein